MWAFSHVRGPVPVEVFFALQGSATIIAYERSLGSVDCKVRLDSLTVIEDGVALWTSIERRSIQSS